MESLILIFFLSEILNFQYYSSVSDHYPVYADITIGTNKGNAPSSELKYLVLYYIIMPALSNLPNFGCKRINNNCCLYNHMAVAGRKGILFQFDLQDVHFDLSC